MEWISADALAPQIRELESTRFALLCGDLITDAAVRGGIDRAHITTTQHITEPDGGIDAQCVNAPHPVGRLIPRQNVDYQFKAGARRKSAAKIAAEDILGKPPVVDGLRRGHAFVYLTAYDHGNAFAGRIAGALRSLGLSLDEGQIVCVGGDAIARLLQRSPALAARFLGLDLSLVDLQRWSRFSLLGNPFQTDATLDQLLAKLTALIEQPRAIVRVVGPPGAGKTRGVLEALQRSSLPRTVLYAPHPNELSSAFIHYLGETPDVHCTVVVDGTDEEEAERLAAHWGAMPAGVRLITIGVDASGRARQATLRFDGLGEHLIAATISAVASRLPGEVVRSIARVCGGSPKLAVLIAHRIHENPALAAPHRLLADGDVYDLLDRYLGLDERDEAWAALSAVALVKRLGWSGDVAEESDAVFRAVGLDPAHARAHVARLDELFGVAPMAGRFRHVSPAILADQLALRRLRAWSREQFRAVLGAWPSSIVASLARRVRGLSAVVNKGTEVGEAILGHNGLFRTLTDLERGMQAMLLRELAPVFPHAALVALQRMLDPASDEELHAATGSRRETVWALEALLWREDTFEEASELLLRLAVAENERVGNNATETWVEAFQTMLGRTAAGPGARTRVLRRAGASVAPAKRVLAARALGAALKTGHLHRSGMPPTDVEDMPAQEWRPETWGEWVDATRAYLTILVPLLSDVDVAVRRAAAIALATGLDAALELPGIAEEWLTAARTLTDADYDLRRVVNEAVELALQRLERLRNRQGGDLSEEDGESLDDAARARREAAWDAATSSLSQLADILRGTDFSARFRWTLTRTTFGLPDEAAREQASRQILQRLEALAEEVILDPSLITGEWQWLADDTAGWRGAERFVEVLGRVDRSRVLGPALSRAAREVPSLRAGMWPALYDLAYAYATQEPGFIERRADELLAAGAPAAQIFDLLSRAGYTVERADRIIGLLGSSALPGAALSHLAYSPWGSLLPPAEVRRLAVTADRDPGARCGVITFVAQYLEQVPSAEEELRDLALELLLAPSCSPASMTLPRGIGVHSAGDWPDLALRYIAAAPTDLARSALAQLAAGFSSGRRGDLMTVLRRAWEVGDKATILREAIGPWLEAPTLDSWHLHYELRGFPLWELGADTIQAWIAGNPQGRAYAAADVMGPPAGRPSDAHAMLLDRFGDYGTGNAWSSTYRSGMSVGSRAVWCRAKLDRARPWLNDERLTIREWASELARQLEADIEECERTEAEERVFW